MPKRIVDGEGVWRSDKIAQVQPPAWRAEFADAYDLHMRPLPVDQCAGSVAAQKKRVA